MKIKSSGKEMIIFSLVIILLLFNFISLSEIIKLRAENRMWKNKVLLSIEDQELLYEHSIEGEYLGYEISELLNYNKNLNQKINKNRYMLICLFKGISCDRCISNEINIFKKYRKELLNYQVLPIMIFVDIAEEDYVNIIKSANVEDISVKENIPIKFNKFNELKNSIILFVDKKGYVIMACVLDNYRDESRSDKFYNRVIRLMENL
jgi:hypothetical protein